MRTMKKTESRLIKSIGKISSDLHKIQSSDGVVSDSHIQTIVDTISALPENSIQLRSILATVEQALKGASTQGKSIEPKVLEKLIQGVRVAGQSLSIDDTHIREMLLDSMLSDLMDLPKSGDSRKDKPDKGEPVTVPLVSLDDVAMLLIQTDATRKADLVRLKDLLSQLSNEAGNSLEIQSLGRDACAQMEAILDGTCTDPNDVIEGLSRKIERFSNNDFSIPSIPSKKEAGIEKSLPPEPAQLEQSPSMPAPVSMLPKSEEPEIASLPIDSDTTLIADFITESRDLIEGAEVALLTLETDPEDAESVNTVFRAFHTIKGTSAFLGLKWMTELAHHAETLLSRVRDKEIHCTGGYADLALRSSDMLKNLLQTVQDALGGELMHKPEDYDHLMMLLINPEAHGISTTPDEIPFKPRLGDILLTEGLIDRNQLDAALADKGKGPLGVALVRSHAAKVTDVAKALRTQKRIETGDRVVDTTVRVKTDRLDKLIDMVGELVIAQSMLIQDEIVVRGGHVDLQKKVTHGGKLVRELQDLSMSMRMVPLKATFQKMTRLVRDLAHKSGKQVDFVSEGEDTEIDRNMVDVLNDPLVHIIRNSLDHGIEMPDVRESTGKARTGTVRLSAFHAGGNVVVELQDDGKGLDRERILKKAIERGLIEADRSLTESEIMNLIFAPGFSTAEKITDVSGRGVGMDVVKRNIEKLHGKIEINSTPGKGCLLTIRVPLTLAITDGMLVKVGSERYLLPTINIFISFRPESSALFTVAARGEMVMLRGELMPIVRLHRLFGVSRAVENPCEGLLVVIGEGEDRCALLVDELLGQQQVVAKNLGSGIGRVPGVAGGAILGNGRVGLILDPVELTGLARQSY